MKRIFLMLLLSELVYTGCLHNPGTVTGPEYDISSFINIWEGYESDYPLFTYKDINWINVAQDYYPLAEQVQSGEEMMMLIGDMLAELEDPALFLISPDGDTIHTCVREYQSNVDMSVLLENYLEPNGYAGYEGGFGWCDPQILPYAYFDTLSCMENTAAVTALDEFIAQCILHDVPAVILDVRMNPVGTRYYSWFNPLTMSRFLEFPQVGAVYRYRIGPKYDQYSDFHPAIDPAGPNQYLGTVYLLTGGGCTQAAEDMAANMEYFPNTVLIGDTTAGSSTAVNIVYVYTESADEPWLVPIGYSTLLTYQYQWVENAGVAPDISVEATEADFAAGVDPVLEYAMNLLEMTD